MTSINDQHKITLSLIEDHFDICGIVAIAKDADGNILLGNSAQYLIHRTEAEKIIAYCNDYLSHIDEEYVKSFNDDLKSLRQAERRLPPVSPDIEIKKTFLYLIYNKRTGLYKIGRSKNPAFRERTLQSDEPEIELIITWPGTSKQEAELHQKFNDKRVRGEWFKLTGEDIIFIKGLMLQYIGN